MLPTESVPHYHVLNAGQVLATYPWREAAQRKMKLLKQSAYRRGEYLEVRYLGFSGCDRAECRPGA